MNSLLVTTQVSLPARLGISPHLYVVTYDLRQDGQDYPGLIARLNALGGLHIQQSVWWIASYGTAIGLRDNLLPFIDCNDSLMVGELVGQVAGHESRPDVRAWIQVYIDACSVR